MFKLLQVVESKNQAVEIINAIGNAWQVLLILVIVVAFICYGKKIARYIAKFNKVSGKTSLGEVNLERSLIVEATEIINQEKEIPEQVNNDNSENEISKIKEISFYEVYLELIKDNLKEADTLFEQIQKKTTDPITKETNYLFLLFLRYHHASINTISEIENIANSATNSKIRYSAYKYLGECFLKAKEFSSAIANLEIAFTNSGSEDESSYIVFLIAGIYFETGRKLEAINYLNKIKDSYTIKTIKSKMFATIAKYYDGDDEWIQKCLALELAVANDPNNTTNLFEAAYVYSNSYKGGENKFVSLSLLHYQEVINYQPDSSGALNNIGVAYGELDLPNKSNEAYKKATELKNSLASSNLANKFISIGCFEEAVKLLNAVKDLENVHENVWSSLKKVKDNTKNEEEREDKIMKEAKLTQFYLREFARLYFKNEPSISNEFNGNWKVNGTNVEYTQYPNPDYFELKWVEVDITYSIVLNNKKGNAIICNGTYSKKDSYITNKLSVFAIVENNTIRLLLFDKKESIGFRFLMFKD